MTALAGCTLLAVLAGFGLSTFGPLLPCALRERSFLAAGWAVRHRTPMLLASGIGLVAGSMAYIALGSCSMPSEVRLQVPGWVLQGIDRSAA